MALQDKNAIYTYKDYLNWPEGERWELIHGIPYMQAAPSWQHQSVVGEISRQFSNYLLGKNCRVFSSPFDLRIPEDYERDEETTIVLQPDVLVVCDASGLSGTGYFGVPDMIVEVASPSTSRNDKLLKFNIYEKAGVKEYWIAEPDGKFISVFTLGKDGRYGRPEVYADSDKISVSIFTELEIELSSIFNY